MKSSSAIQTQLLNMQYKGMTEVHVCQMSPDSLPNTGFYYEQERRWLSNITKT